MSDKEGGDKEGAHKEGADKESDKESENGSEKGSEKGSPKRSAKGSDKGSEKGSDRRSEKDDEKRGKDEAPNREEVDDFIKANSVDDRAAEDLRQSSDAVKRAVLARGDLSTARNPSAALLVRIRDARVGGGNGGSSSWGGVGLPTSADITNYLKRNGVDKRIGEKLRTASPTIKRLVLSSGDLGRHGEPNALLEARIAQAKSGGTASLSMAMPAGMGCPSAGEIDDFIKTNDVDQSSADQLRSAPPAVQRTVLSRGDLRSARNPSSALLARIRDAKNAPEGVVPMGFPMGMPPPPMGFPMHMGYPPMGYTHPGGFPPPGDGNPGGGYGYPPPFGYPPPMFGGYPGYPGYQGYPGAGYPAPLALCGMPPGPSQAPGVGRGRSRSCSSYSYSGSYSYSQSPSPRSPSRSRSRSRSRRKTKAGGKKGRGAGKTKTKATLKAKPSKSTKPSKTSKPTVKSRRN
mmetsp:Transcript_23099/g.74615  ORF Transcript_23099/g.74615 Transcript_23099/m.74615 type:complete len:460 (+) Transcript_23099:242-1621(+)